MNHHLKLCCSLLMLVGFLLLSGCTNLTRMTSSQQTAFDGKVTFTAPVGWVRAGSGDDGVVMTRDGGLIQTLNISFGESDKVLKNTKAKIDKTRLPKEIAELVMAEVRTNLGSAPLTQKEISPLSLGGSPGFHALASFRNDKGAPYDVAMAGALIGNTLLLVSYQALSVHFFERDVAAFNSLVKSLTAREK